MCVLFFIFSFICKRAAHLSRSLACMHIRMLIYRMYKIEEEDEDNISDSSTLVCRRVAVADSF